MVQLRTNVTSVAIYCCGKWDQAHWCGVLCIWRSPWQHLVICTWLPGNWKLSLSHNTLGLCWLSVFSLCMCMCVYVRTCVCTCILCLLCACLRSFVPPCGLLPSASQAESTCHNALEALIQHKIQQHKSGEWTARACQLVLPAHACVS